MERGVRGNGCSWKGVFVEKGIHGQGVLVEMCVRGNGMFVEGVCSWKWCVRGKGCLWKGLFVERGAHGHRGVLGKGSCKRAFIEKGACGKGCSCVCF